MNEIKVTVSDIEFVLDRDSLNDWEILEMMSEMDENNFQNLTKFARMFYGSCWDGIKAQLREQNNGSLRIEVVSQFIADTINAVSKNTDAVKN